MKASWQPRINLAKPLKHVWLYVDQINEEIIHTHKDCDLDSNTHSIICTTIRYIYD